MPAATVALTTVGPGNSPAGPAFDEQASAAPATGNDFDNAGGDTMLYVRNTTAGALDVILEADVFGVERTVLQTTIPGSATEHGVKILGPFKPEQFNDHSTTVPAGTKQGRVMVKQAAGIAGDLVFCPIKVNRSLL
jgi:hypothetical protein